MRGGSKLRLDRVVGAPQGRQERQRTAPACATHSMNRRRWSCRSPAPLVQILPTSREELEWIGRSSSEPVTILLSGGLSLQLLKFSRPAHTRSQLTGAGAGSHQAIRPSCPRRRSAHHRATHGLALMVATRSKQTCRPRMGRGTRPNRSSVLYLLETPALALRRFRWESRTCERLASDCSAAAALGWSLQLVDTARDHVGIRQLCEGAPANFADRKTQQQPKRTHQSSSSCASFLEVRIEAASVTCCALDIL